MRFRGARYAPHCAKAAGPFRAERRQVRKRCLRARFHDKPRRACHAILATPPVPTCPRYASPISRRFARFYYADMPSSRPLISAISFLAAEDAHFPPQMDDYTTRHDAAKRPQKQPTSFSMRKEFDATPRKDVRLNSSTPILQDYRPRLLGCCRCRSFRDVAIMRRPAIIMSQAIALTIHHIALHKYSPHKESCHNSIFPHTVITIGRAQLLLLAIYY